MLTPEFFASKFNSGLSYDQYVATGNPQHQGAWQKQHQRVILTPQQQALIAGFTRQVNVLVTSGLWCGDCSAQVPMLDHIATASPLIQLRLLDRDEHLDLSEQVKICGGLRVPTVLFLNEDFDFVSVIGDKCLSRLRSQAARALGAHCNLAGAPEPENTEAACLADWVADFERVHLLVRLSPKLRERHGD